MLPSGEMGLRCEKRVVPACAPDREGCSNELACFPIVAS